MGHSVIVLHSLPVAPFREAFLTSSSPSQVLPISYFLSLTSPIFVFVCITS
jgi:hypothetical protein